MPTILYVIQFCIYTCLLLKLDMIGFFCSMPSETHDMKSSLTWFPALDPDDSCLALFHRFPTILSNDFVIKFSAGSLAP